MERKKEKKVKACTQERELKKTKTKMNERSGERERKSGIERQTDDGERTRDNDGRESERG